MKYKLHKVTDKQREKIWLDVAREIYQDDPVWVCPLDAEVKAVFNPEENEMFEEGDAARWYITDKSGRLCGRIAAFFNHSKATRYEVPTGGTGFFECIEDQEAANLLFNTAKKWLEGEGMEAMDGPVNFGENDMFWGLLVHGYTHPSYGMPYNKPYYQQLFENYGFKLYFEQTSRHLLLTREMPERFQKIARWITSREGIEFRTATKAELAKYGKDFMNIFNDAWKFHEHFIPMTEEKVKKMVDKMKHVIIEKFMIFGYVNGDPAGFLFCLPDLNQIMKPWKGKITLWRMLMFKLRSRNSFAWYRKRGILTRGRVLIIGVKPKYQKHGIETGLTMHSMEDGKKMGFKEIELSWVGEFNPMSLKLQAATGAELGKIHYTYRYMFDPEKTFIRPELMADPRLKENKE